MSEANTPNTKRRDFLKATGVAGVGFMTSTAGRREPSPAA